MVKKVKDVYTFLILRLTLGLLFVYQGFQKLSAMISGNEGHVQFFDGLGIPAPEVAVWLVGIVELVGGLFLIVGFLTWWTSAALGLIMIAATLLTGFFGGNIPTILEHLIYIGAFVALMLAKDVSFALDKQFGWKQL